MNERIKELAEQATNKMVGENNTLYDVLDTEKFAELIVKNIGDLIQERWYELNNEPKPEDETLRDIGMRVGKKSELVRLQQVIKQHFGVE